jgi:hypothetical protein
MLVYILIKGITEYLECKRFVSLFNLKRQGDVLIHRKTYSKAAEYFVQDIFILYTIVRANVHDNQIMTLYIK